MDSCWAGAVALAVKAGNPGTVLQQDRLESADTIRK